MSAAASVAASAAAAAAAAAALSVYIRHAFRWKREQAVFTHNWPLEENRFLPGKSFEPRRFVNVLVKAKDGGNVLRPHVLDEIQFLNTLIMQNVSVPTYDRKFNLTYQDLCLSYDWVCGANEHIEMFRQASERQFGSVYIRICSQILDEQSRQSYKSGISKRRQ